MNIHKPYLLVQPFMTDLKSGEYRSYFVAGRFITCVHTKWEREEKVRALHMAASALRLMPVMVLQSGGDLANA